jgi:hypothetical protein
MADLILYIPDHGLVDTDAITGTFFSGTLYVADADTDTFKLAYESGGSTYYPYTTDIISGYVRRAAILSTVIYGLQHLEGQEVVVVSGGEVVMEGATVTNGTITVPEVLTSYIVGKPYTMKLKTENLEVYGSDGQLQGRVKKIRAIEMAYLRSGDCKIGEEHRDRSNKEWTEYLTSVNLGYDKKTDNVRIISKGGLTDTGQMVVKSDKPYPLTVLSLIAEFSVEEVS